MMFKSYIIFLIFVIHLLGLSNDLKPRNNDDKNINRLEKIFSKAQVENWRQLPIGKIMGRVAMEFIGIPYKAYTLEKNPERCVVNLEGMDCVTFFENVLNISRLIKESKHSYDSLIRYVTFTRYRSGILMDYTSRLHYTSEWIMNNEKKGIIKDITQVLGGIELDINVYFMSKFPEKYNVLKNNPKFVKVIKKIEEKINKHEFYYIPKSKIKGIESRLQTGDIVAFATNIPGLDYSHVGLIYIDETGVRRLLHASSKYNKVYLDKSISDYIKNKSKDIGVTIVRAIN